jgi:DNA-binding IclR family transcriptional regulator
VKKPLPYSVPALEKSLDILECLATHRGPMTQSAIARELDRGQSEIFRMLTCLERRGYIRKESERATYSLTLKLFELAHTHDPFKELISLAQQPMRELARSLRESCHLSVLHQEHLLVIAQEQSLERVRLSIEVGGSFPILRTVSGRLLLAFASTSLNQSSNKKKAESLDPKNIERIQSSGFEETKGETSGVYDLAVIVGSRSSKIQAALAVASITNESMEAARRRILPSLRECAEKIQAAAGLLNEIS